MNESRRNRLLTAAVLTAVPTVLFLDILVGAAALYSIDITFYFVPVRKILREIVLSGEFPFWNPLISAGQPLAANPAYEVFYPPTWLILLPDYIYGFHLLALGHLYLAIFSTYALIRSFRTGRAAACVGALSFGLGGFALSSLHLLPILFSAAWMPLTCLFTRRFLRDRRMADFSLASASFAMQLLIGEPMSVLQTGILLGLYALFATRRTIRQMAARVAWVGAISITALVISSVQTLPMLDHYRDSVRNSGFDYELVADWSTPPIRFAELLFPDLLGTQRADSDEPYWGQSLYGERGGGFFPGIYCGVLLVVLAIAGVAGGVRGSALFLAAAATSIVLALGDHTPLLRSLYDAGIAHSLRYPEKFVMLGIFAAAVFAGVVLDRILGGDRRLGRLALTTALTSAVVAGAGVAATMLPGAHRAFNAYWNVADPAGTMLEAFRHGWMIAVVRGSLLALLLLVMTKIGRSRAAALFVAFVIVDLTMQMPERAPRVSPAFHNEPPPVLRHLDADRGSYRVFMLGSWNPNMRRREGYLSRRPHYYVLQRNALLGMVGASWGVRGVVEIDYDLTALKPTNEFTLAAWELSHRTGDWLNYVAAMSNIRYIGTYQSIADEIRRTGNDVRLMEPVRFIEGRQYPRYYFASDLVQARGADEFVDKVASGRYDRQAAFVAEQPFRVAKGRVLGWRETTNTARIHVEAEDVAFLVMSVTPHKFWNVTIDGVGTTPVVTNLGYQGVVIPRGRHVVEMRYSNPLIAGGAGVSLASIIALALLSWRASRRATPAGTMRSL